jgi:hypothetical protein
MQLPLYRISSAGSLNLVLLIFDIAFSVTTKQSWKYLLLSSNFQQSYSTILNQYLYFRFCNFPTDGEKTCMVTVAHKQNVGNFNSHSEEIKCLKQWGKFYFSSS